MEQEKMAGRKKKLKCSEETPWFPEYFGWIGIGNCDQETSNNYNKLVIYVLRVFHNMYLEQKALGYSLILPHHYYTLVPTKQAISNSAFQVF